MEYKNIYYLLIIIFLVSCGVSQKEADEAYKNGMAHLSTIKKKPERKADALYFLLIAVENNKYKTADNAIIITSLAADIYSTSKNLSLDDKLRLEKNIITGCKLLLELYNSQNEIDKNKSKTEIKNIVGSNLLIHTNVKQILKNKDINLYQKFLEIGNN